MKKTSVIFSALFVSLLLSTQGFTQTVKDIFKSETRITYLGVDFSRAKLIGDAAADPYELKNKVYSSINQVIINEAEKYNIQKAIDKSTVNPDIMVTEAQNAKTVMDSIKSQNKSDFSRFSAATIDQMIRDYNFSGKTGIGLVFVVEAMSKTEGKANIWVTFVSMPAGKVLFTERMQGKASGFGYRNYWVRPIYEILTDLDKGQYDKWKATYGK